MSFEACVSRAAREMRDDGYTPDIVVSCAVSPNYAAIASPMPIGIVSRVLENGLVEVMVEGVIGGGDRMAGRMREYQVAEGHTVREGEILTTDQIDYVANALRETVGAALERRRERAAVDGIFERHVLTGFARRGFTEKARSKALELLKEYMTGAQYAAFIEKQTVELVNNSGSHRLLISKNGSFTILEGITGEGIVAQKGRITEDQYPLGDEIAAFIDWFRFKTGELIKRWECGNYRIIHSDESKW